MKAKEFIDEYIGDTRPSDMNRSYSRSKKWELLGKGTNASVWRHIDEPDVAVKVIGGGTRVSRWADLTTKAFLEFCKDHANNPHYPRIISADWDKDDRVIVKMERLIPLDQDFEVGLRLFDVSNAMEFKFPAQHQERYYSALVSELEASNYIRWNDPQVLCDAIRKVIQSAREYAIRCNSPHITIDLHKDNFMVRQSDAKIVIVDPWHI